MTSKPLFPPNLLSAYVADFRLSSVTGIRDTTLAISGLIEELESSKLERLKEEEIKSRFITTFFGDVLGFNYGNSNRWLLREEKKAVTDGKKADAALGFFYNDNNRSDVRAVIELKDARTDLDSNQKRHNTQSPVQQAFSYAQDMGGNCKWVIVSNIKEIRFYPSLDKSKCQVFYLKDLTDEDKLKELLFLFHKDRFIKENGKSATDKLLELSSLANVKQDKPYHILDQIYNSLKRFEGLGFVDPNYLSTIRPFNILSDHVWHYNNGNLFTINNEIYSLLNEVTIDENGITLSCNLLNELKAHKVVEAEHKIEWIFIFLNHCLIYEISAIKNYKHILSRNKSTLGFSERHHFSFAKGEDGVTKNINLIKSNTCDCLSCNYRNLDFDRLLGKLKAGIGNEDKINAEYAYGNYLVATNNFKTSYTIYKAVGRASKGKQNKGIEYFLSKYNIRSLHNLILSYENEDSKEIMEDVKSVDLDKVIYDEIEFDVDNDVKKYLIDIKEDTLIFKLQDEIEEINFKIDELKSLYENGGERYAGPDLVYNLYYKYMLLYAYINRNYIIYDIFIRYKKLTEKFISGLVANYQTPTVGLKFFDSFVLTEAILHIYPNALNKILSGVETIRLKDGSLEILLEKLRNFTGSYYRDGLFSDPYENALLIEQLNNHRFKDRFTDIFANLFIVLVKIDIDKELFASCVTPLIKFLKIERELAWYDLQELATFLEVRGNLFEATDLLEILKIAVHADKYGNNKYNQLLQSVPKAFIKHYPNYKIDNVHLVKTILLKCTSEDGNDARYSHLVHLYNACDEKCKQTLLESFEVYLDRNFNADFYEHLLRFTDYDVNRNDYFLRYCKYINSNKGKRAYKFGKNQFIDLVFINFILLIYKLSIDFDRSELKVLTELNDFETWLLKPAEFDYKKFNPKWLIDLYGVMDLTVMRGNLIISKAIDSELKREFNPVLAEIKYKHIVA